MDPTIIQNYVLNFTAIVWEALPFIVLGALIAGILEEILPQEAITRIMPKHFLPAVLIGGGLGLIFPMCECGIVVVMRRLLRKGVPLASCIAYMLAGPIVNVIVLLSTYYAFKDHTVLGTEQSLGWPMVGLRAGLGFLVACGTGIIVYFVQKRSTTPLLTPLAQPPALPKKSLSLDVVDTTTNTEKAKPKSLLTRLGNITDTALRDFLDITLFLIIGSALAAFVKSDPSWIAEVEQLSRSQPFLAIPALMGLGFLLCLCSEADAFLAASFKGMSISAKLAFLVFGPMLDIKLVIMYTRVFRLKLIITIMIAVTIQVLILCSIVHMLYNPPLVGLAGTVSL